MARVIIIGPGHPLRGGLATFNQRLAKEFINRGNDCYICSFSLQYPSFLFPGKTQYSDEPPPEGIRIVSWINSINPFNWLKTGWRLKKEKPDLIVVRYWLPIMGPALGTILRRVRNNRHTRIICIADNIIPHEKRPGDNLFTRYFLKACDGFITMSEKVLSDLRLFEKTKPARYVRHPLYDNFGEIISKKEAKAKLGIADDTSIILFFGFIRAYKGLDILLRAISAFKKRKTVDNSMPSTIKFLVAGEFYEDEKPYRKLIEELNIEDLLIMRTNFIPDSDVKYYLCAADAVVQPYRQATQSGVTPLAYHFEKPMLVTNVGGLPSLVPHEKAGLVMEPEPEAIAESILRFYQLGENYFISHLRNEKLEYSWGNLVNAIVNVASEVPGR